MKTKFIYCLICPKTNKVRYIGKSKDPSDRLRRHLSKNSLLDSTKKNNWLVSLLRQNLLPEMEIIDEVFENEIDYWEKFYIELFRTWGFDLLNGTNGGDGFDWSGRKHTEESKLKNKINNPLRKSVAQYDLEGNFICEYLSLRDAGQKTGINKAHISRVCRGTQKTSGGFKWKFIDRINPDIEINSTKNRVIDFDVKNKFSTLKKISVYKLNGELVGVYNGISETSRKTGCHFTLIKKCCELKGYYQTKNLTFRYDNEPFDYVPYKNYRETKNYRISQYDLNGLLISEYDSLKIASDMTGIGKQYISKNCKENDKIDCELKELKGYIFKFSQ